MLAKAFLVMFLLITVQQELTFAQEYILEDTNSSALNGTLEIDPLVEEVDYQQDNSTTVSREDDEEEEFQTSTVCADTEFGCCPDGVHPAHGPENLGCCAAQEFGCCPDNWKAAKGPYGEGCDCKSTEFGCCPDEMTPAKGVNSTGCGCQYSTYGCCPDATSTAEGSDFQGCACYTFENGCCPDGITVAQGPNLEECLPCNSEFGCCPDGITLKTSDDEDECTCESSEFGCCPDGNDNATGPDFAGCADRPDPQCHVPEATGPCHEYEPKWFYDVAYGGCSRFWYGGCDPGQNHFDDESTCKSACVSPRGSAVCRLKKMTGSCAGHYEEWYYDVDRHACMPFVYSGCLGNGNRFPTKSACEDMCTPQDDLELCAKPKKEGACAGQHMRYYYDSELGACTHFNYSGCEGNNNRFLSMEACESACAHRARSAKSDRVCSLQVDEGACAEGLNATLPRWAYDGRARRCAPFYYTGCGGGENMFASRSACEDVCPTTFAPIISLPGGTEILAERRAPSVILPVSVRANPPASVEWLRGGRPLSRFNPRYSVLPDGSLKISRVTDIDAGAYSVRASNGVGQRPTEVHLSVIVYPLHSSAQIKLSKSIFMPADEVRLECEVKGYPPPQIMWYRVKVRRGRRTQQAIKDDERPRVSVETYQTGAVSALSTLALRNVSGDDSGSYRCEVTSQYSRPASATEGISVQLGPDGLCVDRPSYKHCHKIVEHKFCGNKYYGQYCCLSCTKAGFLPGGQEEDL